MKAFLVPISILVVVCCLTQLVSLDDNHDTCGKCITAGPDHAWCMMEGFTRDRPRCDTKYNLIKAGCNEHEIFRPDGEYYVVDDRPLSNKTSNEEDVVQLRPQRIRLRLPPHITRTVTVQYKQVVDYPVDLYYLMDLSKSMQDDKEKLKELGNQLASNMQAITSNFRLGFGSFVDKVASPMVSTVPEKLEHPCPSCAAPYGFRNHMPLSTDTLGFTREVGASQISGNLDAPEGGLDAVMQAIVCQREVNWREKSRKMLVYTTDASFHSAGDGKLAGIVTPNDGKCHLNSDGLYTESTEQDYPSISQINQKAQEHHVNIIFAATSDQVNIYKKLTPLIEGSSAGRLDNDSSNIVDLIEEQYRAISSEIELKDNATSHVQLTYHSACLNEKRKETNICKGLKVGSTISFDIDVKVVSCPKRPSEFNQTIKIYPVGLNEALLIDLEMICECDCEKPWNIEYHSPKCSNHGDFICGQCQCDPFRYGKNCECDAKEHDPVKDLQGCMRYPNETRVCSGRGECICGACVCHQKKDQPGFRIDGPFCECDNMSCPRHEGIICSGPDHGECVCGTCQCKEGWTGPACECPTSQEVCRDPKSKKICAGHGECICGSCNCLKTDERQYSGAFCQDCPFCPTMCEQYKDCVRCKTFGTGPLTPEECNRCLNSTFDINIVDVERLEVLEDETLCVFTDDDDCTYEFKYKLLPIDVGDATLIHSNKNKNCPRPLPFFLILLALALLILLLGLLGLLLWKCLTMWKDRQEVAKFEKEKPNWETGVNPIFKQATSTYTNPFYKL